MLCDGGVFALIIGGIFGSTLELCRVLRAPSHSVFVTIEFDNAFVLLKSIVTYSNALRCGLSGSNSDDTECIVVLALIDGLIAPDDAIVDMEFFTGDEFELNVDCCVSELVVVHDCEVVDCEWLWSKSNTI